MEKKKYLECAIAVNTHGVKGDLKLESLCDSPSVLAGLKRMFVLENGEYREIKVIRASVFKGFVLAKLDGIDGIDAALLLKGKMLYADRNDFSLEPGSFFISDLIGLDVIDITGREHYGRVIDVINRGASDIYVVKTATGERMIPAVDEFIKRIDLEDGIFVSTIPGLLKDE